MRKRGAKHRRVCVGMRVYLSARAASSAAVRTAVRAEGTEGAAQASPRETRAAVPWAG